MPEYMLEETIPIQLINGDDKKEKGWSIYNWISYTVCLPFVEQLQNFLLFWLGTYKYYNKRAIKAECGWIIRQRSCLYLVAGHHTMNAFTQFSRKWKKSEEKGEKKEEKKEEKHLFSNYLRVH